MVMAGNPRISTVDTWDQAGALAAPLFGSFQERYAQSYRAELDHFADVLAGAAEPVTAYAASLGALRLAEAAGESVRTGRVVQIKDI
jgi:myo-inositol 2-dehydrogenase/D-chiro-inositol 1-dehydrogenase